MKSSHKTVAVTAQAPNGGPGNGKTLLGLALDTEQVPKGVQSQPELQFERS